MTSQSGTVQERASHEISQLLRVARERVGMDLVVFADESEDGRWQPIASAMWNADSSPPPLSEDELELMFDSYLLDVRMGPAAAGRRPRRRPSREIPDVSEVIRIQLQKPGEPSMGMLVAFGREGRRRLTKDDTSALRPFAAVLIDFLVVGRDDWTKPVAARKVLRRLQAAGGPAAFFQPIATLADRTTVGYEALARFPLGSPNPSEWFRAAAVAGQEIALELDAARASLGHLPHLQGSLSINVSESTLCTDQFRELVESASPERIVIELTEQRVIENYPKVVASLDALKTMGVQLAIDDVGSGYATLNHVLELGPDIIKLDLGLVHAVDTDPRRQALVHSLTEFADRAGMRMIAEGIETAAEFDTLLDLGVTYGQGFHLARPAPCSAHAWTGSTLPVLGTAAD